MFYEELAIFESGILAHLSEGTTAVEFLFSLFLMTVCVGLLSLIFALNEEDV